MNAILPSAVQAAAGTVFAPERSQSEFDRLLHREWTPRDMLEGSSMDKMLTMAEHLANSRLSVPEHLRGNIGDCLAIVTQAMLWNMNPFAVAQKTHLVNGKLGYEAQLVNAVVQNSGAVRGAPRYEYGGDDNALRCRVGYVLRGESEITWGEWLSSAQVTTKNSPLWKTNPKQQMGYLQLKNWARAFCPGAILGVYTTDELEDFRGEFDGPVTNNITQAAAMAPTLPAYAEDAFATHLPAWTKLVADGRKSASDLLATLSTRATFSEEQKAKILSLKKSSPPPETNKRLETGEHDDFLAGLAAGEGSGQ